jgi:hypothetical protein
MQIVFNNPIFYVADYPAQDGVEIVDKRNGSSCFLRDGAAQRFREAFVEFMSGEPDMDACEDFIDQYDAMPGQPVIYH